MVSMHRDGDLVPPKNMNVNVQVRCMVSRWETLKTTAWFFHLCYDFDKKITFCGLIPQRLWCSPKEHGLSVLSDSEAVELNDFILEYFSYVNFPFLKHKYDGFNT